MAYGYFVGDEPMTDEQQAANHIASLAGMGPSDVQQFSQWAARPVTQQMVQSHWAALPANAPSPQPPPRTGLGLDPSIVHALGPIGTNAEYQSQVANPGQYSQVGTLPPSVGDALSGMIGGVNGSQQSQGQWWQNLDKNPMYSSSDLNSIVGGSGMSSGGGPPSSTTSNIYGGILEGREGGYGSGYQASPYGVIDSFMNRDPVHILGVNGFRTGMSSPMVDYSGPLARQNVINNNMAIDRMLGMNDQNAISNALEIAKFSMASQDRQDAIRQRAIGEFDRTLAKTPPGPDRDALISEAERNRTITPQAAAQERLNSLLGKASISGKMDPKTGQVTDMEGFLRGLSTLDPNTVSRADVIKRMEGMGITPDQVYAMREKPGLKNFVDSLMGPSHTVQGSRTASDLLRNFLGSGYFSRPQ